MRKLLIILSVFIISSFLICANVDQVLGYDFQVESGAGDTAFKAGYDMTGELFGEKTLPEKIGKAISIVLTFLGVIFLLLMIYGGYIWMIARDNEQEVEKAKNIIKNALIGLVIVLAAYAITWFIMNDIFSQPI